MKNTIRMWDRYFNEVPINTDKLPTFVTVDGESRRRIFTLTEVTTEPQVFNVMNVGDAYKAYVKYSQRPEIENG